ncbi:double-strand break repair helicase AddA [Pararhodobacter sp.]|uniref:double-strand break repair helicase AddA n=1 Tax=Pararhodobacter sp. TaxID=2127056 RepID=UPI002AFFE30E|nr:double-strand break repair helicase AddA [Pararhodobacter sp.]
MHEASQRQIDAAHPGQSTWLSANAGSGKTKVLTDRVARLLLHETPPQRILCLTYTKAAASEMQNRLFRRLGQWAMLPDPELIDALRDLGEDVDAKPDILLRARRLFARAIETPGGLKIQTIHAFCSAVLRRFPLEAAVSPDFSEAEERSLQQLRVELLDRLAQGPDAGVLSDLLTRLNEDAFGRVLQDLGKHRDGFEGDMPDLRALFDLPPGYTEATLLADAFDGDELDLLSRLLPFLRAGSTNDIKLAKVLAGIDALNLDAIATLEGKLLFSAGAKTPFAAKVGKVMTGPTQAKVGVDDSEALDALALRIEDVRLRRQALDALRATETLHRFARLWLPSFDAAKTARGWLDFDDLIRLTRRLLGVSSVAQWVLFKLDGGIDHILVDEAQDTSPEQWRVIDLLTQEFAAGQGARHEDRTIFVVGDRKQSIYSFQGADLRGFEATHDAFHQRLADAGQALVRSDLKHSFRSSDAILRLVDHCFAPEHGDSGLGGASEHVAFHLHKPGRVDLWPAIEAPEKDDDQPWFEPLDRPSKSHPEIILAHTIAQEIRAMIDRGEQIDTEAGPRPVHEGDFLILVRRRRVLFNALIRSCKALGLEIAGADRLLLSEELAVQDLIALLKFLALPEDDLSLAVALRSPVFGWSEDRLYRLAQGRGDQYLWEALRHDAQAVEARAVLDDLRRQVDFLRPFELIERILTKHDRRHRIRARFGAEVDEALEAFVDLALSYEQGHIPSLDGFLGWLEASDAEVKRQTESAGRRVRVMTVHGAKGLEAPIVILPDTAARKPPTSPAIAQIDGVPILRTIKANATEAQLAADAAAAALREEENDRLLYVALTRAESWLIVACAGDPAAESSWYAKVALGMESLATIPLETALGEGARHEHGVWPRALGETPASDAAQAQTLTLADIPAAPAKQKTVSPTALGGAKALAGAGDDTDTALARGSLIHRLLEVLPTVPDHQRAAEGLALLARSGDPDDGAACLAEALSVLANPELAQVFDRTALIEVAVAGTWNQQGLWGVIDRLLIDDTRVLAIDFKSNRVVPRDAASVPEGILRQMGAYAHLLAAIYPGRRIETALLWTSQARLMMLDAPIVNAALARAALDPAEPAS